MKERAEAEQTSAERQHAERCRQYEQQLQEQANQLAEGKALLAAQREEIQRVKDTLAILKGQKGRPKIKPRRLERGKPGSEPGGRGTGREQKRAGSEKRAKTLHLKIAKTEIQRAEQVPAGAVFKGYPDYVSQELEVRVYATRSRCERWQTPDGGYVVGRLPEVGQGSHFGPTLRSSSLYQSYPQQVTQPLLVEYLPEVGVDIAVGPVNRSLTEGKGPFPKRKTRSCGRGWPSQGM